MGTVGPAVRSLGALSADGQQAMANGDAPEGRDQHEHLRQHRPRANEHGRHGDRRLKRDRDDHGEEGRPKFQRADEEPHGHADHGRANSVQHSHSKTMAEEGQHPRRARPRGASYERRQEPRQAARNTEPPREHPAAREADAKGSHQQEDARGHVPLRTPRPERYLAQHDISIR